MVKITRLPSGSYRARVHLGGGKYKSITGKDKKDVQLRAAQLEADIKQTADIPEEALLTLGEAMQKYIDSKSAILSPSTIRGYDSLMRTRVDAVKDMRLCDLTQEAIQKLINADAVDHSPKSVRNLHCFISAVLDVYRHDLKLDTSLPQRKKPKICIPTKDEIDKLVDYFYDTEMEIPFLLAACCGLRESEICGLKWGNVDLEGDRIYITSACVMNKEQRLVEKGTKSESGERVIRLYPYIKDALVRARGKSDGDRVTQLHPRVIYGRFTAALKKLGFPHYRFHDLRHYLVSVMLSLNIPKNYIADFVGHADETMIDRVYGHIMETQKTTFEDMLQSFFEKSVTKSDTKK